MNKENKVVQQLRLNYHPKITEVATFALKNNNFIYFMRVKCRKNVGALKLRLPGGNRNLCQMFASDFWYKQRRLVLFLFCLDILFDKKYSERNICCHQLTSILLSSSSLRFFFCLIGIFIACCSN